MNSNRLLGIFLVFIFHTFASTLDHSQTQEYVDLSPFLNTSFQEAIQSIGCQPLIIDIPQKTIQNVFTAFSRSQNLEKICEVTDRWSKEFASLQEGPWENTNYRFGIFDNSKPTHKKNRLIQGINCKISREYCDWVRENHNEELTAIPELELLFQELMDIEEVCHAVLIKKIEEIAQDYPNMEKIFYSHEDKKRIPLSIRITRYDNNGKFCLPLHNDISVLSLIFPSDDDPTKECLIIAPPEDFTLSNLRRPVRPIPHNSSQISTILLSGVLMPFIEIPIPPSPHAVLPHDRDARTVIIVCCHLPNVCTSHWNTVLDDMQELPEEFKQKWGL